jgi:hypothetical protein
MKNQKPRFQQDSYAGDGMGGHTGPGIVLLDFFIQRG